MLGWIKKELTILYFNMESQKFHAVVTKKFPTSSVVNSDKIFWTIWASYESHFTFKKIMQLEVNDNKYPEKKNPNST